MAYPIYFYASAHGSQRMKILDLTNDIHELQSHVKIMTCIT